MSKHGPMKTIYNLKAKQFSKPILVPTVHKEFREFKEKFLKLHRILQDLPASESSVFVCYQV